MTIRDMKLFDEVMNITCEQENDGEYPNRRSIKTKKKVNHGDKVSSATKRKKIHMRKKVLPK